MTKPREWTRVTAITYETREGLFERTDELLPITVREVTEETARLPEFDEKSGRQIAQSLGLKEWIAEDGAYMRPMEVYRAFEQLAHIIAAKDAEIRRLEEREELLRKRIRGLEAALEKCKEQRDEFMRECFEEWSDEKIRLKNVELQAILDGKVDAGKGKGEENEKA